MLRNNYIIIFLFINNFRLLLSYFELDLVVIKLFIVSLWCILVSNSSTSIFQKGCISTSRITQSTSCPVCDCNVDYLGDLETVHYSCGDLEHNNYFFNHRRHNWVFRISAAASHFLCLNRIMIFDLVFIMFI